jgi:hypothetical protein
LWKPSSFEQLMKQNQGEKGESDVRMAEKESEIHRKVKG